MITALLALRPLLVAGVVFGTASATSGDCGAHWQRPALPEQPTNTDPSDMEDPSIWVIKDADAALALARKWIGMESDEAPGAVAELLLARDDATPYLWNKIEKRKAWRVTFKNLELLPPEPGGSDPAARISQPRTVDVYLGPARGDLFKIVSRWPEGVPAMAPEASAKSATKQLEDGAREVWHAFATEVPSVTLRQALGVVEANGGGVRTAKQLVVHCVRWSMMDRPLRLVWSVNLRGVGPFETSFPGVEEDARNHMRNIVDAQTKEWLTAISTPQPDQPAEQPATKKPEPKLVPQGRGSEPPADSDPADRPRSEWLIGDPDAAIAQARKALGLEADGSKLATAELVIGKDNQTPYLSRNIDRRKLWCVTFQRVDLLQSGERPVDPDQGVPRLRDVDVYVSPVGGLLFKVVSRWPEGEPPMAPEPSAESATLQLSCAANEVWYAFAPEPPKVSLAQALRIIQSNGGDARGAKQIVAYCVQWSIMDRHPAKRAWSVNLRGITPFEAAFPGGSEDARNHLRHIVDAETGEWLKATTSPQPEKSAEQQRAKKQEPKLQPQAQGAEPPADFDPADKHERATWVLQNPDAAIERARKALGLDLEQSKTVTAELVVGKDDQTPYLWRNIDRRKVWCVTFEDLDLVSTPASQRATDGQRACLRVVDVYLSPVGGVILKVVSRWPDGEPPMAPEPSADSATKQIANDARETWYGFVTTLPKIDLVEALRAVQANGGDVSGAKQIVAHCVRWSIMGRPPKPAWSINLRGIRPFPASHDGVPEDARNHLRHIVDAETGEWHTSTTSPQPDEPAKQQGEKKPDPKPAPPGGGG